jgi:hypothetical protein
MFMLWLAVQAGMVQAHVVGEELHALQHGGQVTHVHQADEDHSDEPCGLTHCCHPTGLLTQASGTAVLVPLTHCTAMAVNARSRTPPHDIERPKWALATPAVASL